jgi:hypothetical protein
MHIINSFKSPSSEVFLQSHIKVRVWPSLYLQRCSIRAEVLKKAPMWQSWQSNQSFGGCRCAGKDKKKPSATARSARSIVGEINISLAALTWRRGPSVKPSPVQQFPLKRPKPSIVAGAEVTGQH